jgi:flagellar basal body rod protein FlgG
MEYYFSFHVDSIDEMVNLIINQQKYQIERKLGFDFDKVDNSIIDLIKMVMI